MLLSSCIQEAKPNGDGLDNRQMPSFAPPSREPKDAFWWRLCLHAAEGGAFDAQSMLLWGHGCIGLQSTCNVVLCNRRLSFLRDAGT